MKFNTLILVGFIMVSSNVYCAEVELPAPDSVQPSNADLEHGYYFDNQGGYVYRNSGEVLKIVHNWGRGRNFIRFYLAKNRDVRRDHKFGEISVPVPTYANLEDLKLLVRPDNGSILILDKKKGDIIVFDKEGKLKGTIQGKDEHGNIDSNLIRHKPFASNSSATPPDASSNADLEDEPLVGRNLQEEFDAVANPSANPSQVRRRLLDQVRFQHHIQRMAAENRSLDGRQEESLPGSDDLPPMRPALRRQES
jgi:hypothetical protein